jgi:spermidine synthase
MTINFEELDYQQTYLGELILRRRGVPSLGGQEVFEVKLGDAFLMSSLFTTGEIALAKLGLTGLDAPQLEVVIGGLGLGYTTETVLDHPKVKFVLVIEALAAVINWHQSGLVPLGPKLVADQRCHLIHDDFFMLASSPDRGFDPQTPGHRFHAILLDIDHSPRHLLHPNNAAFYEPAGLSRLTTYLHPGGVFAQWSNDPPDDKFLKALDSTFAESQAHVVTFHNPLQNREAASTVYVARTAMAAV